MTIRIAFILQVHKNYNQLNKFINQISIDGIADVYIHIDKKSYNHMYEHIVKKENVKVLKESIDIMWGDISQVDATLLLIKEVIKSGITYDFVCFRSGQDLLVRNGLVDFLERNKNKIFMTAVKVDKNTSFASLPNIRWPRFARKQYKSVIHPKRIIRRLLIDLYGKGINLRPKKHKLPNNYDYYHGSSWFIIPYEVCTYIVNFLDKNAWYYQSFKEALCPDEWFFQTLIMNSKYKKSVINDNLMYLRWGENIKERNHPVILTMNDINLIEESGSFFARKFDENIDSKVIEYFVENVSL